MTAVVLASVGLGMTSVRWQIVVAVAVGVGLVGVAPSLVVVCAGAAALVGLSRRWQRKRRAARLLEADVAALCDLVALALTGGLGLQASLQMGADEIGGTVGAEVSTVLRQARVTGLAAALRDADGAGRRLFRVLARAAATGSEVMTPMTRLADEMNSERAAARLEAVRRLPVLMLLPLTTLILPGFLLLAIAPAIIDAFARLEF